MERARGRADVKYHRKGSVWGGSQGLRLSQTKQINPPRFLRVKFFSLKCQGAVYISNSSPNQKNSWLTCHNYIYMACLEHVCICMWGIYMTPQLDYIVTSGVCEIQRGWGSLRPGAVNTVERNHKTVTHNSM